MKAAASRQRQEWEGAPLVSQLDLVDGHSDGLHVRQHAHKRHLDLQQRIQQALRLA